jgi:hypothetical protein
MQAIAISCLVLLLATGSNAASVTPVQKVIELLNGMAAKSSAESDADEIEFAKFKSFCDNTAGEKQRAIADANEQIKTLKADIEGYAAEASKLGRSIKALEEDIAVWTGDQKAATSVREIEKGVYDKTHKDYSESVSALGRAIDTLKKGAQDKAQAFTQMSKLHKMDKLPKQAKQVIASFLQEPEGLDVEAPESAAYESRSGGIIKMLEEMLDKFIAQRTELEKTEMDSVHAYEMLMQDLTTQIEQGTKDKDEQSEAKAKALQNEANASGSLEDVTGTRDADSTYLTDLVADCEEKAGSYEDRMNLRKEEIEAIEKATEIISSGAVSGAADKHLPGLLEETATSFAQLRSEAHSPAQERTARFLQMKADKIHSRVLSALAIRVAADPFMKVKKMIKDLIMKLMEEANEEAEHNGLCDK